MANLNQGFPCMLGIMLRTRVYRNEMGHSLPLWGAQLSSVNGRSLLE